MRPAARGRGFRARNPTIVRRWNEASLVAALQLRCYDDYHQGRIMHIETILAELRAERGRIDQAISALEAVNSTGRRRGRPPGSTSAPKKRGRMSAAARRKLSRLLKQRWAQGKMKPRASAKPVQTSKPARRVSRAARKRMAAAQRARWAKVRAQQQAQTKAA